MSRDELVTKFQRTASYVIDEGRIEELAERVTHLDKEDNAADLTPLLYM
jgi:hypothetical protein